MPPPAAIDPAEHPTTAERASRTRGTGYIPTLDGWRAVAIVWVIFNHSQIWTFGRFSTGVVTATGGRGVTLFFALSGFLICTRLLREESAFGSLSIKSFYIRRLFRIQPAALTYLLIVAVLSLFGIIPTLWSGIAGAALMVRNFWPASHGAFWYTVHFWSLSVEEHFYLLLPGFLLLCRRRRLPILASAFVLMEFWRLVVLRHHFLQKWAISLEFRTDIAIGGILIGCVFAVVLVDPRLRLAVQRWLRPWMALLVAGSVFTFPFFKGPLLGMANILLVFPLLIAATVLHPHALLSRFLEFAPIRFIGRVSYSLYLWQQLFLNVYTAPAAGSFRSHNLLSWAAAFACAIISFYLIETPFVRIGHRIAKRFDHGPATQAEPRIVTS
jgi:peptidoglycan/LPS O-acetylase OafA/YrhL